MLLCRISCTGPTKVKMRKRVFRISMWTRISIFLIIFLRPSHRDRLLQKLSIHWPLLSPSVPSKRLLPLPIADNIVFVCQCVIDRHPPVLKLELEDFFFFLLTKTLRFRVLPGLWKDGLLPQRSWTDFRHQLPGQQMQLLNKQPLCYPALHALHPRVHLCWKFSEEPKTVQILHLNACFEWFSLLLDLHGAAAIILPTFKTIKLHVIVNNAVQIGLKWHFPGEESPAEAAVAFVKSSTFCEEYGRKSFAAVPRGVDVSFSQFSVFTTPTSSGGDERSFLFSGLCFPLYFLEWFSSMCCASQHIWWLVFLHTCE